MFMKSSFTLLTYSFPFVVNFIVFTSLVEIQ